MSTTNEVGTGNPGAIRRHAVAVPFGLGFLSGVTAGGLLIGGVFFGYPVGRAGVGAAVGSLGSIVGTLALVVWLISGMVNNGCPSCADAIVVAWVVPFMYLVPFLIGVGIGSWRRRRIRPLAAQIRS
jgi:hypothetical protein